MATHRKAVYTATLPATPVVPGMRSLMESIARKENRSLAEIQRAAILFFLAQNDRKTIINDTLANDKRTTDEILAAAVGEES